MPARTLPPSLAAPQVYESRPVRVVAMQWRGDNYLALREFLLHNLGPSALPLVHLDTVRFLYRGEPVRINLGKVIMFVTGERPRFRIVTEGELHAAFKMVGT